jgi:predicted RNA-binding Zn ribbon-like protein
MVKGQMNETMPAKKFEFIAGALCLDFCNTVGGSREGVPREFLNSINDFISWAEQAGVFDGRQAADLRRNASQRPAEAAAVLDRAIELREALYRIFFALMEAKPPRKGDLAKLNAELAQALGRLRVEPGKNREGFQWQWAEEDTRVEHPLGPIARSAAEILTGEHMLRQVRHCHGANCGWLFLDSSKNHSRRWCDMRDCGNRAKVRRQRMKE